jgi:hypothetical protein
MVGYRLTHPRRIQPKEAQVLFLYHMRERERERERENIYLFPLTNQRQKLYHRIQLSFGQFLLIYHGLFFFFFVSFFFNYY